MPTMSKAKPRSRFHPAIILIVVALTLLFVWGVGDSYLLSTTESDTVQQQHNSDPSPSDHPDEKKKKNHQLQVAWLMSFGGAGTSYTITNIETVTGRTTASNYGDDYDPCIPVYDEWTQGPFLRNPTTPAPNKYILTKTHCGGYCMDCGPGVYYLSEEEFFRGCLTGKKHLEGGGSETVTYDQNIPQKAVHLIRNPFDNLVGRMHLYNKHNDRHDNHGHFDTTIEGLQSWCSFLDDKYAESEKNYPLLQEYKHVPCHGEWYKYIQWHNLAYKAQQKLDLPVHYLYYDHYSTQHEAAVDGVLEFLQESRRNDALSFLPGKTYRDIFTEEHIKAARKMTKTLMKPKMWKLIKHYFD